MPERNVNRPNPTRHADEALATIDRVLAGWNECDDDILRRMDEVPPGAHLWNSAAAARLAHEKACALGCGGTNKAVE